MTTLSEALHRSRKPRQGTELLCERAFQPLAHVLVVPLARLRVRPPLVVAAACVTGLAAAIELARGQLLAAALLLQLKTVLDNADGQLARLTGGVTVLGRYLDSELDLTVDAALFAALGWYGHAVAAPIAGFLALTAVLSINFSAERLYRAEHHRSVAAPSRPEGRATAALRRTYAVVYGWQDALVEGFVERRLRGRGPTERRVYHDRASVSVLANLGLSTQLAAFGALTALGRPFAFVWLVLAELGVLACLALRREALLRGSVYPQQEVT
jgi:archaetidylinositol phosphate synthase